MHTKNLRILKFLELQIASNQNIQGISYVCNEIFFDGFLLTFDKIFLETTFKKSIALFMTLLLAPLECKLVHHSSHSESLKLRGKSF